jgi:hypothetical protein
VQIFFIGLLGEYILSINQRVMKRPLVVEEERLNFSEQAEQDAGENSVLEQLEQAISEESSSKQSGQDDSESRSLGQPVHQGSSSIEE